MLLQQKDLDTLMEEHPQLVENILLPSEFQRFRKFTLPKRQREWLAGRICAKAALQKQLKIPATSLRDFLIGSNESGRPCAKLNLPLSPDVENIDLSISHSGEIACALVADCCCGIDLQEQKDTLIRVQDRFCSAAEKKILARIRNGSEKERLVLLWCAKEACRKACSSLFLPEFHLMQLQHVEHMKSCYTLTITHPELKDPLPIVCKFYRGYGLALCLLTENIDA